MLSVLGTLFVPVTLTLAFLLMKFLSRDTYKFKVKRFNLNTKVKLLSADPPRYGRGWRWYGVIGLDGKQFSRIREVIDLGDLVLIENERIEYSTKSKNAEVTSTTLKNALSNYSRAKVERNVIRHGDEGIIIRFVDSKEDMLLEGWESLLCHAGLSISESIFIINNHAYIFSNRDNKDLKQSRQRFNEDTIKFILKTLKKEPT